MGRRSGEGAGVLSTTRRAVYRNRQNDVVVLVVVVGRAQEQVLLDLGILDTRQRVQGLEEVVEDTDRVEVERGEFRVGFGLDEALKPALS